jgi:hypothetical protein
LNMGDKTIRYTGEILNCIKHGAGAYKYPGTEFYSYEGGWENGEKHASNGKFTIAGYSNYEGNFQNGEITGAGKRVWEDGRSYVGEWLHGEMHGKGVWISADSQEKYEGDFKDNKRDGKGQLNLHNGDTYNGSFSLHKYHGEGVYLKENCFFISSEFKKGMMDGKCSVKWHKLASFDGLCVDDVFSGHGHFVLLDGTFEYEGSYLGGRPEKAPTSIGVTVDRSAVQVETDPKKDKKKKPAGKKGAVEVEPVGVVPAGQDLGQVVVTLQYASACTTPTGSTSTGEPAVEAVFEPILISNGQELRRQMHVRLRAYIPPAPLAKGAPPQPPNPDAEMGDVLPMWRRRLTAEERSTAWERFPLHSLRFVNGINPLSGEKVVLEGAAADFAASSVTISPPAGANEEEGVEPPAPITETIIAASIPVDQDSCVSYRFTPQSLRGASEQMSFLADWRIADVSATERAVCEIGAHTYALLPVLSLSHVVGDMEASGRLDLLLLSPHSGESSVSSKWSECLWELRMTEGRKSKSTGEGEVADPPSPTAPVADEKVSVLCRWADASEFDPLSWHSVALSISAGGAELTVDGAGRMKSGGAFEEGTAEAWLPEKEKAGEGETAVDMVYRVGYGAFAGQVKSMAVCTKADRCDLQRVTGCFAEWTAECLQGSSSTSPGGEGVAAGMEVVQEAGVVVVGGRGVLQGVVIPEDTAPGAYVLEVFDAVNELCLLPAAPPDVPENGANGRSDRPPPQKRPAVDSMHELCRLVPSAGSSKSTHKLSVE